jgi:predicted enzyme related to lactoylglutathione lyase
VFGWSWGGDDSYAQGEVDGGAVAGVTPRPPDLPSGVPDHWLVYFGTPSSLEADVERARTLGATVTVAPREIPGTGRFAALLDPLDAPFALFEA